MKYRVKKGIGKSLRISGMLLPYFYAFVVIVVVLFFLLAFVLLQALSHTSDVGFGAFLVAFFVAICLVFVFKIVFTIKTNNSNKFSFKKIDFTVSNIDIVSLVKKKKYD